MEATAETRLTVLFEDPFWVGLFERICDGRYSVCKIIFGAEPRDFEVYEYILSRWDTLAFSPALESRPPDTRRINPKRRQRMPQRQTGIGTKAQQALKLQQEQAKAGRKIRSRQRKEADAARKFRMKEEKRKEKHRGH